MSGNSTYSLLAILRELNDREFKRKLDMFTPELKYYVILSGGIVGSELAKRVKETPEAIVKDGGEFVSDMLNIAAPGDDEAFKGVLERYLVEILKDELRFCCMNCRKFNKCLDIENLQVGTLFERLANGEDNPDLREQISVQSKEALSRVQYLNESDVHKICAEFEHQYSVSDIGEVFGRYSNIAAVLQQKYGIDHKTVLQLMVPVNMDFCEKSRDI